MATKQALMRVYESIADKPQKAERVSDFIAQYKELNPCSAADYNKRRKPNSPTWLTIAHTCGLNKWYELLEYCKLDKPVKVYQPVKRKAKTDFVVHIKTDLEGFLEKLDTNS